MPARRLAPALALALLAPTALAAQDRERRSDAEWCRNDSNDDQRRALEALKNTVFEIREEIVNLRKKLKEN